MELEEELKVVGNSLKSLEVSEEKANQRVEEFKKQLKSLTVKLKEAEARAEYAEKTVKKLQKEVDRLEGMGEKLSHSFNQILLELLSLLKVHILCHDTPQINSNIAIYLYSVHLCFYLGVDTTTSRELIIYDPK